MKNTPAVALLLATTVFARAATLPLSRLDLAHVSEVGHPAKPRLSAGEKPIVISGRGFADGFGTRGSSRLQIALDGKATSLHAWIGMTDDTVDPGPVWFEVLGDGQLFFASNPLHRGDPAEEVAIPLAGVKTLVLVVEAPDQPRPFAAWAEASIDYAGKAPVAVDPPSE